MTPEEFTTRILQVTCFPDPTNYRWWYGIEPKRTYGDAVAEMASRAEPSWLPFFFAMYATPPQYVDPHADLGLEYSPELQQPDIENWRDTVIQVLGSWAQREPEIVLPAVAAALEDPEHRLFAAEVFAVSYTGAIVPYIRRWVDRFEQLTDEEAQWLIEAVSNQANAWHDLQPEARTLLERLQEVVPESRVALREDIRKALEPRSEELRRAVEEAREYGRRLERDDRS